MDTLCGPSDATGRIVKILQRSFDGTERSPPPVACEWEVVRSERILTDSGWYLTVFTDTRVCLTSRYRRTTVGNYYRTRKRVGFNKRRAKRNLVLVIRNTTRSVFWFHRRSRRFYRAIAVTCLRRSWCRYLMISQLFAAFWLILLRFKTFYRSSTRLGSRRTLWDAGRTKARKTNNNKRKRHINIRVVVNREIFIRTNDPEQTVLARDVFRRNETNVHIFFFLPDFISATHGQ